MGLENNFSLVQSSGLGIFSSQNNKHTYRQTSKNGFIGLKGPSDDAIS